MVQSEVQWLLNLDKLNGDLMAIYMVWFHLYTDIPIFPLPGNIILIFCGDTIVNFHGMYS